ncbi:MULTISPECIES: DUF4844 domain-containing protein [unclassified Acinetobacter calcoaceticus/baumannii complex]|uniref:DUF4844 domain-containing protein n=1 Tax=unclassified Acinetobacter calcoaceticus/baumannii complex TaxID=2881046 RepID=UPI00029E324C|nr:MULTISPECIES: DUF4844 domain-containing protein [unclassified Acinetobacter calcoaceticus/baumannii complex]EKU53475.1 hypothetical protein ACINWC323_3380 [Acinetobacter sp. WC-323]EXB48150.1 hypothetical protein J522_1704 [Acinetobacter baumannii 146457]EYT20056.1 hypothetical protein J699_02253 [Acinetobacter sp. 1000160]
MKLFSIFLATAVLLLCGCTQAEENKDHPSNAGIINQLNQFQQQDHFLTDGQLYSGVQDPQLKKLLNKKVAETAEAYIQLYQHSAQPSKQQRLKILSDGIHQIDPDSLGTDDREQVAGTFEHFLDITGLESSEGILNTWLYNEEINELIEKNRSKGQSKNQD